MGQVLAFQAAVAENRYDDLTGLYTRKSFYQRLERELLGGDGLAAMLMIDVDHYKQVNDTYGHLAGDVLLAKLAEVLRANVREQDLVARYAGDEFVVMLPGASREDARQAGRRLCEAVSGHVFKGDGGAKDIFITISVGVAAFPTDGRTAQDLVRAADRALYHAKNTGRNRVCGPDDIVLTHNEADPYEITFTSRELVGRQDQLAQLHRQYHAALEGRSGIVMISGEAGIGKTRLVNHFLAGLPTGSALILRGTCYEATQGLPYGPVTAVLRDLIAHADIDPELKATVAPLLAGVDGLTALLPELPASGLPQPIPLNPAMARFRLFEEICRVLIAAAQRPLVLFFDDLQWADGESLSFIEYFIRSARRQPVAVVGTYRSEEVESKGSRHALLEFRSRLSREGLYASIELGRLTLAETGQLIKAIFNTEFVTDEFTQLIFAQSDGNPFFVEQVLKMLVEEGAVYPAEFGWHRKDVKEISIPSSINDVLARRLNRLAGDARQALALAAIIGEEFQFEVLHALSGLNEGHLLDIIDQGINAHVIQESDDGERYVFAHPQLRSILYHDCSARRRKQYHLRVAEIMAGMPGAAPGELADHYLAAGCSEKALEYLLLAAKQASEVYAHHVAIKRYSQALDLIRAGCGPERALEINEALGDAYFMVGDERANEAYSAALAMAGEDRLVRGRLERKIGTVLVRRGNLVEGLARLRTAMSELEAAGAAGELMTACGAACGALVQQGKFDEAEAVALRRLELAREEGGLPLGMAYADLAHVNFYRRDYAKSEEYLQTCIQYLSDDAGLNYAARAYNNLGATVGERGDTVRALEYFNKALAAAEKVGNVPMIALICGNLAEEHAKAGRLEEGQDYLNRALSLYQRIGSLFGLAESWLMQVYIYRVQDRMTEAREAAQKALQAATDGDLPEWIIRAQCALAEVLLAGGLLGEAADCIAAAEQRARDAKMDFLLAYALRARAWLRFLEGRLTEAEELIREAIGLFERFGLKFELAQAHRDYGRLLIKRDGHLSEAAQREFSQALALFESTQSRREFDRTVEICQDDTREVTASQH